MKQASTGNNFQDKILKSWHQGYKDNIQDFQRKEGETVKVKVTFQNLQ